MRIYKLGDKLKFNEVKDARGDLLLSDADDDDVGKVYFIDLEPFANWAHFCVYLFDTGVGFGLFMRRHTWPPSEELMKNAKEAGVV